MKVWVRVRTGSVLYVAGPARWYATRETISLDPEHRRVETIVRLGQPRQALRDKFWDHVTSDTSPHAASFKGAFKDRAKQQHKFDDVRAKQPWLQSSSSSSSTPNPGVATRRTGRQRKSPPSSADATAGGEGSQPAAKRSKTDTDATSTRKGAGGGKPAPESSTRIKQEANAVRTARSGSWGLGETLVSLHEDRLHLLASLQMGANIYQPGKVVEMEDSNGDKHKFNVLLTALLQSGSGAKKRRHPKLLLKHSADDTRTLETMSWFPAGGGA